MANNYTQSSFVIDNVTPAEAEWIDDRMNSDWWEKNDEENQAMYFDMSIENGNWYISDDGTHMDADQVALMVREFLHKFRPKAHVIFDVCYYCDKPRPDEFGGFSVFVNAREIMYFNPRSLAQSYAEGKPLQPHGMDFRDNIDRLKEAVAKDPEAKPKPEGFEDCLGSFGPVIFDGWCGEPVAWGFPINRHLGSRFDELRSVAAVECVSQGSWVVVTDRLTPEMAEAKYGPVTELKLGPRGGFKHVTYGDKTFLQRDLRPEGQ